MGWTEIGVTANVVLALAYFGITYAILVPLARTGQLWRNHLGLSTGLIFLSCGVGHGIHVDHSIRLVLTQGWSATDIDWHLGAWDAITAVIALVYWHQRSVAGTPADPGTLFEDLQRRQRELEAETLEAGLREELATERALVARQWFARAFESAPNGMALVDSCGRLTRVNEAFATIVGSTPALLVGRDLGEIVDLDVGTAGAAEGPPAVGAEEVQLQRTEGPPAWARLTTTPLSDDGASVLVQLEDVTKRRQAEERLNHLALHDPLTGLPNRLLFHDRTTTALHQGSRSRTWTGCLFIDLDHFKVVNDSMGHEAGDKVLRAVAQRLLEILRPGDTVARMGGDEFCLLLQGLDQPSEAASVAERVLAALDGYVEIDGVQVTTAASVGVAVASPDADVTSQMLVRDSDTALYRAKASGRGHQVIFDESLRDDAEHRLRIEAELRAALHHGEIEAVYQPQWSLSRRRIVGVEALVRWQHPLRGELAPDQFLGVAIETGLIVELGRQVMEQALHSFAGWLAEDPDLELAVNLSSRQLGRPGFIEEVRSLLEEAGVPASALCLELTETDLTELGRSALRTLHELRELGIRLAVDDVGTGESSLTHLVTLPVDVIKIDRTFVSRVHLPGAERAVVEALLSLSQTLGFDVIAEGGETMDQADALAALGCDVVQGYLFGRPMPAAAITHSLQSGFPTTV